MTLMLLAVLSLSATAITQTPSSADAATLQSLLAEVRQLRLAVEKAAVAGPRIQLAMQRLQLQEQRTAHAAAQFDEVRIPLGAPNWRRSVNE
jgi:hypothetical protein